MKKEQRQKILLLVLLGAGAIYAYSTYLLLPEWGKIKSLQQSLGQRQGYYQQLQAHEGNRAGLQTEISQLNAKLKQASLSVPGRLDKPQMLVYLYTMAKGHGVKPQALKFEAIQAKGFYQEMPLSLSCEGKPEDILRLIQDLKNGSEQRLVPQSVNLTQQQGVMRGELKFLAYALSSGT